MSIGRKGSKPKVCPVEVRAIAQVVAAEAGVTSDEVLGVTRRRVVVRARNMAYLIARRWTGASLPGIGHVFGKDHTTVILGLNNAERWLRRDVEYHALYDRVWRLLESVGRADLATVAVRADGPMPADVMATRNVEAVRRLADSLEQRVLVAENNAKAERITRQVDMTPADIPFADVGALTVRAGFIDQNAKFVAAMRAAHGDLECALA